MKTIVKSTTLAIAALAIMGLQGCFFLDAAYYLLSTEYYVGDCDSVELWCTIDAEDCYYYADGERFYHGTWGDSEYSAWNGVIDYCAGYDWLDCTEFYGYDLGDCYSGRFCEYSDGYAYFEADGLRWACSMNGGDYCDSAAEQYYYECNIY